MEEYLKLFKDFVVSLGEKHQVDPLLLGCLYLVSKVSLVFFLGWALKNLRAKKTFSTQLIIASVSFSLPYLYLIIAGRNLSVWVYVFIGAMFVYGGYSIWRKIATKADPADA